MPVERAYEVLRDGDGQWEVHAGGVRLHHTTTLQSTLLALEWQLVTDMLGGVDNRFHLHGSALLDPSGTLSVLVLGESGVGKTTITLALMTRGFLPYTDDVVLIDPEAMTPETFKRAFHVDVSTRSLMQDLPHATDWETAGMPDGYFMPSHWATRLAPVGAVIFPKRHEGAEPLLVGLRVAEAAVALVSFSGTLERDPALALRMAARLTASVSCHALYPGPLRMTAEFLDIAIANLARHMSA